MEILLISEKKIKSELALDENIYGKYLLPSIKQAQAISLQTILGTTLLNKIYQLIETQEINRAVDYKILLDEYIQDFLIYETMTYLIPIVAVKIDNIGVVINQDEKVTNISKNEIDYLIEQYKYKADFFKKNLQVFLCKNHGKYPELSNNEEGIIKPNLQDTESCSIFLGGIYKK